MAISGSDPSHGEVSCISWSPCGQFIATLIKGAVEVWDPLTFGLLSTLQPIEPTPEFVGDLTYSPDGCSLACASSIAIVVWDIQTGGVVREIQHHPSKPQQWLDQLVWSLDGGLICAVVSEKDNLDMCRYDVASGTALSPVVLQSKVGQYLWAHNKSFRVITSTVDSGVHTFDIFEVGGTLTKIGSFPIQQEEWRGEIGSFSPTTYCVSFSHLGQLLILDIQKSGILLDEKDYFADHSFSSDGGHFAASSYSSIHIWKFNGSHYTPWRNFPTQDPEWSKVLLSPTSPLVLGNFDGIVKLWYLGGPSKSSTVYSQQLSISASSGVYITTANYGESTVTITNTVSNNPSQYIDTDMEISGLALIGNVLLVMDSKVAVAWQLTEEGLVDNVFGMRRASHIDTIWSTPLDNPDNARLLPEDQAEAIRSSIDPLCLSIIDEQQERMAAGRKEWDPFNFIFQGWNHLHNRFMDGTPCKDDQGLSDSTFKEGGWAKDDEGKHLLWIPIEWGIGIIVFDSEEVAWFPDVPTIWFESAGHFSIIVKPQFSSYYWNSIA